MEGIHRSAAYLKTNNIKTPAHLQINFTNGISNYLQRQGHRMIGWNDILGGLHGNNDSTDASVKEKFYESTVFQFWKGDPEIVTQAALKGYDVVNSYWVNSFFDYDYKKMTIETVYNFDPIPSSLPVNMHHKILGIDAQMRVGWIPAIKDMNCKTYPRIAAAAGVAWTHNDKKIFENIKRSLNNYLISYWKKMELLSFLNN